MATLSGPHCGPTRQLDREAYGGSHMQYGVSLGLQRVQGDTESQAAPGHCLTVTVPSAQCE